MKPALMRAGGPAVAVMLFGLAGMAAGADGPVGHERPSSGRSPVVVHHRSAAHAPSSLASAERPGKTPARAKASKRLLAPRLADEPLSRHLNANLEAGLAGPVRAEPSSIEGADAFGSLLSVGTFSIGVETENSFKPRSPSGEEAAPAAYDPPHSGVVLPFIGLSAKSLLR